MADSGSVQYLVVDGLERVPGSFEEVRVTLRQVWDQAGKDDGKPQWRKLADGGTELSLLLSNDEARGYAVGDVVELPVLPIVATIKQRLAAATQPPTPVPMVGADPGPVTMDDDRGKRVKSGG